ncbi:carbohydrate ABC transporter permease [Egibacter rhizosphaerae]|uniref:Carbohydrate ABC transporter permease n=2 Tax=Egibacter rhizosphaerae TaxID=1670831 RepID=A0A411YL91_9ACTN|nr:carbohydrate ABC transporter permease [Egibacter rhizosphaerae]
MAPVEREPRPVRDPNSTWVRVRGPLRTIGFYTLLVVVLVPFLFVFYYMVTTSLMSPVDITAADHQWTFTPTLDNYRAVFEQTDFVRFALNSLVIAAGALVISWVVGLPAAYAVARWNVPKFALIILSSRITPGITFLIPWFILFSRAGLIDSYRGMIAVHLIVVLPLVTWLMISFFEELPTEVLESAAVDGASVFRTFLLVALPMVRGGLVASSIVGFIFSWNHFMFSIPISGRSTETLPVAVFNFMSYGQVNWGAIAAAATLMVLPVVAMALAVQRHIVRGLAIGAVKG